MLGVDVVGAAERRDRGSHTRHARTATPRQVQPLDGAGQEIVGGRDSLRRTLAEPRPSGEHALSDGAQALTLDQYEQLVSEVRSIHEVIAPAAVI